MNNPISKKLTNHPLKSSNHTNPHRISQILTNIQSNKSKFNNLLNSIAKRDHVYPDSTTYASSTSDIASHQPEINYQQKIALDEQMEQFQTTRNMSKTSKVGKIMQLINDRDLKLGKRRVVINKIKDKNLKKQEVMKQQQGPILRNKKLEVKFLGQGKSEDEIQIEKDNELRKSYLDFNPKDFVKNQNGVMIRFHKNTQSNLMQSQLKSHKPQNHIKQVSSGQKLINKIQLKSKSNKLIDVNYNKVKQYISNNNYLHLQSSPNTIYDYFTNLLQFLQIKLDSLLIKKYKNCIYFGQSPPNTQNGFYQGILYHYGQKIYYGQFINYKKCGRGCQFNIKQNTISIGNYDFGNKIGIFKIIKGDQYQYQGQLFNGLFIGYGTLINNQSKYQGNFKNGKKHGQGKEYFYSNQSTYNGNYFQGQFQGYGQIKSRNYLFSGNFVSNLKQGEGYEKTQTQQYRGNFIKGKRQGEGVLIFANGQSYTGNFKQGQIYGRGEYKYTNKKSIIGYFINGRIVAEQKKERQKNIPKYLSFSSKKNNQLKRQIIEVDQNFQEEGTERQIKPQPKSHQFFNPAKLLKIANNYQSNNLSFTQRPSFSYGSRKIINQKINYENQKFNDYQSIAQSNKRQFIRGYDKNIRSRSNDQKYNSRVNRLINNHQNLQNMIAGNLNNSVLNLDYSLADSSIEDDIPNFPTIQNSRRAKQIFKSEHAQNPLRRH